MIIVNNDDDLAVVAVVISFLPMPTCSELDLVGASVWTETEVRPYLTLVHTRRPSPWGKSRNLLSLVLNPSSC